MKFILIEWIVASWLTRIIQRKSYTVFVFCHAKEDSFACVLSRLRRVEITVWNIRSAPSLRFRTKSVDFWKTMDLFIIRNNQDTTKFQEIRVINY